MSDIKKLLESIDSMSTASKNPTGPRFPGYWKGTDNAKKSKSKMVGSAQESILPEIARQTTEGAIHRRLSEAWQQYKSMTEQTRSAPTAIPGEPQAVSQDGRIYTPREVDMIMQDPGQFTQSFVQTSSGPLRSGSGEPVRTGAAGSGVTFKPVTPRAASPETTPGPASRLSTATRDRPYNSSDDQPPSPVEVRPLRMPTVTSSEIESSTKDKELPPATPVRQAQEPGTAVDLVKMVKDLRDVTMNRTEIINNLAALNNISDPNKIKVGQVIRLFDANGQPYQYKIGPGDNLWNISRGKLRGQRV